MTEDYYEVLGLEPGSSAESIQKAYEDLKGRAVAGLPGDQRRLSEIAAAYAVLSNAVSRAAYDAERGISPRTRAEPLPDHYEVLAVHPQDPPEVVAQAYAALIQRLEGDLAPTASAMRCGWAEREKEEATAAYRVLSDPGKRAEYDRAVRATYGRDTVSRPSPGRAEYDPDLFYASTRESRAAVPGPASPRAVTSLVLGVLAVAACPPLGVAAWIVAHQELREIEWGRSPAAGRRLAITARTLGIIATVTMFAGLALFFVLFLMGALHGGLPLPGPLDPHQYTPQ